MIEPIYENVDVRPLMKEGKVGVRQLGRKVGIASSNLSNILNNKVKVSRDKGFKILHGITDLRAEYMEKGEKK